MSAKTLGERIRKLREARGLTQAQVADALGVARSTVAGWEIGRRMPDLEHLQALVGLLGVPMNELVETSVTPVALTAEERMRRIGADLRALSLPDSMVVGIMGMIREAEREVQKKMKRNQKED